MFMTTAFPARVLIGPFKRNGESVSKIKIDTFFLGRFPPNLPITGRWRLRRRGGGKRERECVYIWMAIPTFNGLPISALPSNPHLLSPKNDEEEEGRKWKKERKI